MESYYRLELLVSPENRDLYSQEILDRENTNAGFDLFVCKDATLNLGQVSEQSSILAHMAVLDLGCKARMFHITEGYDDHTYSLLFRIHACHFWLAPRSSIWKSGVMMANSMGIIDSSYRGTLMAAVVPLSGRQPDCDIHIQRGQRLFQILAPDMGPIRQVRMVNSFPETSRGEGGFGSTGR
jgi:hypothetical protein